MAKPKGIIINCLNCSNPIYIYPSRLGRKKYCSRKCVKAKSEKFCIHGHEIAVVGRSKSGHCIGCIKDGYIKNRTKILKQRQKYQKNNKKYRRYQKAYRNSHRKEIKEHNQNYRKEHREDLLLKAKENYEKNKEKHFSSMRKYRAKRMKEDPNFKLSFILRDRVIKAIKKGWKAGSAVRDLGCSIDFARKYIEEKFYGKMTWDNWGKIWELDHIKELCEFDLTDRKQFLEAVHYTNLQPLSIPDHKKKSVRERAKRAKLRRHK